MLYPNQTFASLRILGGALGGIVSGKAGAVANACAFGQITSVPQGYNDPAKALVPTIRTGGNIAVRFGADSIIAANLAAFGNIAATFAGEATFSAAGNVLGNITATFGGEASMTVNLRAIGNMAMRFDPISRPSAADIVLEIWGAQSSAFATPGTMGKKLSDAEKAAKLAAALSA